MRKKQIVFIEGYSYVITYKISKLFKEKGYETILIRLLEQVESDKRFYNQAYDKVIEFKLSYHKVTYKNLLKIIISNIKNLKFLITSFVNILRLKPYVIIGRAPLSSPIAFFRIFFKKTPFVYFPYDIRSQAFPTLEIAKKTLPSFEIKADRFCFEHSDGIMHKGAPNELKYLNGRMLGNNIKLPKHQIAFHPYCSKEFCVPTNKNKLSKDDGELHLVYIGGAGKRSKEFYSIFLKQSKEVIEQKIHIHFYFSLSIPNKEEPNEQDLIRRFLEEYKDYPNIKYFHLEKSFNPKEIVKEISKYDFGISLFTKHKEDGLEPGLGTGNKISTYLEAGIPFFYGKWYTFTNNLRKKYGINLILPKDIKDLRKIIKKLDYPKLEKNVLKMREDYSMEKQFPRLEKFIKDVVKTKKNIRQIYFYKIC